VDPNDPLNAGSPKVGGVEYTICPRDGKKVQSWDLDKKMKSYSTEVLPYLYLGTKKNGETLDELNFDGHKITHIIYGKKFGQPFFKDNDALNYHIVSIDDKPHENILDQIPNVVNFIDKARADDENSKFLIYCDSKDQSLGGALAVGYLQVLKKIDAPEALKFLNEKRKAQGDQPEAKPNHGFMRNLKQMAKDLGITKKK